MLVFRARAVFITQPLLWRKLLCPPALQSQLEFICQPDPDSCLFFLSGEEGEEERLGEVWGRLVGVLLISD